NDPDRQSRAAMLQAILLAYGDDPEQARTANEMIEDGKRGAILPLGAKSSRDATFSDNAKGLMVAIEDYLGGKGINSQHLGNKFGKDQGRIATPTRMRAAIECLPFENPKLSATAIATLDGKSFADALDRAIERSKSPPMLNAPTIELVDATEMKKPM